MTLSPKLTVQKEFFMELASSPIKYRLRALANQIPFVRLIWEIVSMVVNNGIKSSLMSCFTSLNEGMEIL